LGGALVPGNRHTLRFARFRSHPPGSNSTNILPRPPRRTHLARSASLSSRSLLSSARCLACTLLQVTRQRGVGRAALGRALVPGDRPTLRFACFRSPPSAPNSTNIPPRAPRAPAHAPRPCPWALSSPNQSSHMDGPSLTCCSPGSRAASRCLRVRRTQGRGKKNIDGNS